MRYNPAKLAQIHTLFINGEKVQSTSLRYLEELRANAWAEGLEVSRITSRGTNSLDLLSEANQPNPRH